MRQKYQRGMHRLGTDAPKKFNGVVYRLVNTYGSKSGAEMEAEKYRRKGKKARIVKIHSGTMKQGWEVYIR